MMKDDLPPALERILEGELAPGERILWRARPLLAHQIHFRFCIVLCALLFLVAVGGPIWIMHLEAYRNLSRLGVMSFTHFAPIFGLGILCAAFIPFTLWWIGRHSIYAITDRRAILVIQALLYRRVQSFTGEQLVRVVRHENRQGRGSILFERRIGFLGLANARSVEELLRQTYHATRTAPLPQSVG